MNKFKKLLMIFILVFMLTGCKDVFTYENVHPTYLEGKYNVEMKIKNYGVIEMELDADVAPITVTNFMDLVDEGFYNNNHIHRVYKDFVIQGGEDKTNTKKEIKGEFDANGVSNDISHVRGTVSMARAGDTSNGFDTASTQFFIIQKDSTFLDHYYAGFGKVTKGMEVVDKIINAIKGVDENGMVLKEEDMPIIEYVKRIEK